MRSIGLPGCSMVNISLPEHLRITFTHIAREQQDHARSAERLARRASYVRNTVVALLGGTAISTLVVYLGSPEPAALVAMAFAGLALLVYVASLALIFEPRIAAHRWSAARLWLFRERHRALLSDLTEGAISLEGARERRDTLMQELHAVYEQAPLVNQRRSESAGTPAGAVAGESDATSMGPGGDTAPSHGLGRAG